MYHRPFPTTERVTPDSRPDQPSAVAGIARIEWPTLLLLIAVSAAWLLITAFAAWLTPWIAVPALALSLTLHSSLSHEVLHGHPTRNESLNAALVFPAFGLFIPYLRFRDQHLAHHRDETLTDPYDDPESNFLDPAIWARLPWPARWLLEINNTLLGRMAVGPAISLACFWRNDMVAMARGDRRVALGWALHAAGLVPVVIWLATVGTIAPWAYGLAAYSAMSLLKIRTYAEHRAHTRARGRSVIIEDRGPLALLFLNNNLHAVHHAHPGLPWYRIPAFYRARAARFLEMNGDYRFASYATLFAKHGLRRKDPVPHPLMEGRHE